MPPGSRSGPLMAAATVAFLCAFGVTVAAGEAKEPNATPSAQSHSAALGVPEATVAQGRMRGTMMLSRGGRPIYAFRGIPFAKPPIGDLRFQEPVPADSWVGVLNATKDADQCMQKNYLMPPLYPVQGSEDCLYLNVYTPKLSKYCSAVNPFATSLQRENDVCYIQRHEKLAPSARLPVIVYIHGGGFFAGTSSSYLNGPQYLLDHDVVFVAISYRLGALGFLSSADERVPGNAGLKDQTMALRWVRDNVEAFGGDPNLVTIMGQSAGGASVHYHMLSPLSKGLFHRAISQSGTALNKWALPMDPLPIFFKQAEFTGCNAVSVDDALRCLRCADAANLTEASHGFKFWDIDPLTVFRPVVEVARPGAFLTKEPFALARTGQFSHVPWLLGSVAAEGIIRALPILTNAALTADLNARWDEIMLRLMELEYTVNPETIWRNISEKYFGESQPHVDISDPNPFIKLYSDRGFLSGIHRSAELHARAGHKNTFLFHLAYRGRFSYSSIFGGGAADYGVSHCDDLLYVLYAPLLFPEMPAPGSTDEQALNIFTQMWTNFAKYGNPTPTRPENRRTKLSRVHSAVTKPSSSYHGADDAENTSQDGGARCWTNAAETRWTPFTPSAHARDSELQFLLIDAAPRSNQDGVSKKLRLCMEKDFFTERLDFWRSLPLEENKGISWEKLLLLPFFYLVGVFF